MSKTVFDGQLLKQALACKCPKCGQGELYKPGFLNLTLNETCASCGFALSKNDSADGPAVFLIFILGFLLVPIALFIDHTFTPPLWVHAILWSCVTLGLTLGLLKPLKSYVIALQFKHRASDWT
jgi:uncharacterized protein (DUF983 family)